MSYPGIGMGESWAVGAEKNEVYRQSASQVAGYPVRKDMQRKGREDAKVWSRARKGIGAPVFVRVVQRHEEGTYATICRSGLALVEEVE
jgi:hypothetical protein